MSKVLLLILCLSFNTFAAIDIKIKTNVEGEVDSISRKVELDQKYTQKIKSGTIDYIFSNKKPKNLPSNQLWADDSIFLTAKVYNKNGAVVSSPQVATVLGKEAIIEIFQDEKGQMPTFKFEFLATRP